MDIFKEVTAALSEREVSLLLRVFPPKMYKPYDPARKVNHRFLKMDLSPYTRLFIYKDMDNQIKVYSTADMALVSKDTLLAYISSDISLESLNIALDRDTYPYLNLPEGSFEFDDNRITDQLLQLENIADDNHRVATTTYGDTLTLSYKKEVVNFAFVSQHTNSWHTFNWNSGLHSTRGLKENDKIIVNFNPLLSFQNDPEVAGFITLPFVDKRISRYLVKVIDDLEKPVTYNLHSANDYYNFFKYLIYGHTQTNEKIKIIQLEKVGNHIEGIISFLTDVNSMKKRNVGVILNKSYLESFAYDDKQKDYLEERLHFSKQVKENWMTLRTELDGDLLRVSGVHTISIYKSLITRFFGEQCIERVGESV